MGTIPLCPLSFAGQEIAHVCVEENCAWYLKSYKTCSVYVLAHNAALEIRKKQNEKQQNDTQ